MTFSQWDLPLLSDAKRYSNFQCFIEAVTPKVPSNPKSCIPIFNCGPQPLCQEIVDSFSLSSLWDFYTNRSFYGTGVPLLLNNGDNVLQYYCPSLSALQIYTKNPSSPLRMLGKSYSEKQDNNSWSDESENDEMSMSLSNNSSKSSDFASDDSINDHNASCQAIDPFGELYCQYNETLSPYQRVPLSEKINQLAKEYPGLLKFQSTDLSPYSWIAIAWYPIYQIPLTKNVKELSACFVTYHSLSSLKGAANTALEDEHERIGAGIMSLKENKGGVKRGAMAIPPFAVATYKMSGDLWANPTMLDEEKITSCLNAASSWLKLLNFWHHDFSFFMSRKSV